jgi:1-acyl-sn-glycerol-3-phosphate acyltransferase
MTLEGRALWLHESALTALDAFGIRVRVNGQPPSSGLVVSNHLSYLDILVFSAAMPCFFVSKAEVRGWPYFGRAAEAGGTLFLDRERLASANRVAELLTERLKLPVPVLLFPEGTSTDGRQVRRFHSRLIAPAIETGAPITPAAARYIPRDGSAERELCWYGDAAFMPHLWKVLAMRGFTAEITFGEAKVFTDRRVAAGETHAAIERMREEGACRKSASQQARLKAQVS